MATVDPKTGAITPSWWEKLFSGPHQQEYDLTVAMQEAIDSGDAVLIAKYQAELAQAKSENTKTQGITVLLWVVGGFVVWKYVLKGKF